MSHFFLWLPASRDSDVEPTIREMARVSRSRRDESAEHYLLAGLGLGTLTRKGTPSTRPATLAGNYLWFIGEAYNAHGLMSLDKTEDSQTSAFRRELLELVLEHGFDILRGLDGEYVVALWKAGSATLSVANDRYGALATYWSHNADGLAVTSSVRSALMAPGIDSAPDIFALQEAVSFGGYRLGERTNVANVHMLSGGTELTARENIATRRRYWSYASIRAREESVGRHELLERASVLWSRAVKRRLPRDGRPGQTLSGGLDSRAVLAEAAPLGSDWTAVTYGPSNCDDVRIARRAAEAGNASWVYHDPYARTPHWLETRSSFIQATDGLVDLTDLMHVASISTQHVHLDVHLSGYIGDVVCGTTYTDIETADDLMHGLPYYGTSLGMNVTDARERLEKIVEDLASAPPRYAIFEHKFPQSTNRWVEAWRPFVAVRRPFLDYDLFDFWQSLALGQRREGRLYERWLLHRFPHFFRAIPNQRTMVPIMSSRWRRQLVRCTRFAWRNALGLFGLPSHVRSYQDEHRHWAASDSRATIEDAILRQDSICCDVFGRRAVTDTLTRWFDHRSGPTQLVGALYVFETYHRDLAQHLRPRGPSDNGAAPASVIDLRAERPEAVHETEPK